MERVQICKVKRPGPSISWSGYLIASDVFGQWVFTPAGSTITWRIDGATRTTEFELPPGFLGLLPTEPWWFGGWVIRHGTHRVEIDVSTTPTSLDGIWTWSDLELDAVQERDGKVWIEDEDEFEDAVAGGHIPVAERDAALATTEAIRQRLIARTAPFDDTGWRYFDEAAGLGLAPL